jgi:hypothetical protein
MITRCLVVAVCSLLAGRAVAQADLLLPPAAAGIEQAGSSPRPWGQGAAPTRTMTVYNEAQFAAQGVTGFVQINGLRWRANGGGGLGTGVYGDVEVWLSSAATTYLTMSATFAANHGGDLALVYSGPVSVQAASPSSPSSSYVEVSFADNPFAYFTGTDLVVEVKCTGVGWTGLAGAAADVAVGVGAGSMLTAIGTGTSSGALTTNSAQVLELITLATPPPTLVVNEFAYDPIGANREFVEIYNASGGSINLGGWTLRATTVSGTTTLATLSPVLLLPGQFYVVGSAVAAPPALVVDQALVAALPNGNTTLSLRNAGGVVADAVQYGASTGADPAYLGEGVPLFGAHRLDPASPTSWSRHRDGFDTGVNGNDFRVAPWTPKASNDLPDLLPYGTTFDAVAVGAPVPAWSGSAAAPVGIDPLAISTFNPKIVPLSPQGGHSVSFATPGDVAGGRSYLLATDSADKVGFHGQVYFDATLAPPGQSYAWSIGVGGTTDSDFAMPLPTGVPSGNTNGNTGVCWTYRVTDASATLYLISHGPGGALHQILETYPVTTSAWRALQIDFADHRVFARYDGQLTQARVATSIGGCHVGIQNQAPGAALAALRVDDIGLDDADKTTIIGMGGSCDGNCPPKNTDAKVVDVSKKYEDPDTFPMGLYAIPVEPRQTFGGTAIPYTFEAVCVLSHLRQDKTVGTSTLQLFDHTSEGAPGASLTGVIPLQDPQTKGAGWWAAPVAPDITRDSLMFVEFHHDGSLHLPIPADGKRRRSTYWFREDDMVPWRQITVEEPWSIKFLCADTSTTADADMKNELKLATVFTPTLGCTFANTLGMLWLSLVPIPGGLDLGFFGAPSCNLYVDIGRGFGLLGITDMVGGLEFPILLQNDPASLGAVVFQQWFVYDPLVNPLGFITSNALSATIH